MASYLYQLLGMGRSPPTIVPTDEIAPLHLFDDTTTLRGFTLMWTFKFDEVLNADMLGDSLSRLFQMEGWRKLGGRLRRAVSKWCLEANWHHGNQDGLADSSSARWIS